MSDEQLIIGVDPGARETGIVVVRGSELLDHAVLLRETKLTGRDSPGTIDHDYLRQVVLYVRGALGLPEMYRRAAVAIETLDAPNPHDGMTNPAGAIATAAVAGAVIGGVQDYPVTVLLIDPAGHGRAGLGGYPPELVGAREGPAATGKLRHCRSAYDVALAARFYLRAKVSP